jgi:hypothetical protein
VLVSLALGAGFAVLARARARDFAFIAPVVAVFIVVTMFAQTLIEISSEWARNAGVGSSPSWIDRAVKRQTVSVLWYEPPGQPWAQPAGRHRIVWLNEFYNRSVGGVYELGSPMPYGTDFPTHRVRLDGRKVLLEDGRPAPLGPLVLAPCYVRVDGEPIVYDAMTGATVYRVSGPVGATVMGPGSCAKR